jgi:hypothetical protein
MFLILLSLILRAAITAEAGAEAGILHDLRREA